MSQTPRSRQQQTSASDWSLTRKQGPGTPVVRTREALIGRPFELYIDYRGDFFPADQLAAVLDALDAVSSALDEGRLVVIEISTGQSISASLAVWAGAAAGAVAVGAGAVAGAPVVAIFGGLVGAWAAIASGMLNFETARSIRHKLPAEVRELESRAALQSEQANLTRQQGDLLANGYDAERVVALGLVVTSDPDARDAVARAREAIMSANVRTLRLGSFELTAPPQEQSPKADP